MESRPFCSRYVLNDDDKTLLITSNVSVPKYHTNYFGEAG